MDVAEIKLIVKEDGVPLLISFDHQIWPKLCSFNNAKPFLVALFYGIPNQIHQMALLEISSLSTI